MSDSFPLSYRLMTEDEHGQMGNRLWVGSVLASSPAFRYWPASEPEPSVGEAERLERLCQEILMRLDIVLEFLTSQGEDWGGREGRLIDISGSGIKFSCPDAPSVFSLLELRIHLPGLAFPHLQCAGQAIRIERSRNDWEVAVGFTHIREADRERIIQYAFQRSGELLRSRRPMEPASS